MNTTDMTYLSQTELRDLAAALASDEPGSRRFIYSDLRYLVAVAAEHDVPAKAVARAKQKLEAAAQRRATEQPPIPYDGLMN